jgi:hypothetical protein
MPIRASFRYGDGPEIVHRVLSRWSDYGFGQRAQP